METLQQHLQLLASPETRQDESHPSKTGAENDSDATHKSLRSQKTIVDLFAQGRDRLESLTIPITRPAYKGSNLGYTWHSHHLNVARSLAPSYFQKMPGIPPCGATGGIGIGINLMEYGLLQKSKAKVYHSYTDNVFILSWNIMYWDEECAEFHVGLLPENNWRAQANISFARPVDGPNTNLLSTFQNLNVNTQILESNEQNIGACYKIGFDLEVLVASSKVPALGRPILAPKFIVESKAECYSKLSDYFAEAREVAWTYLTTFASPVLAPQSEEFLFVAYAAFRGWEIPENVNDLKENIKKEVQKQIREHPINPLERDHPRLQLGQEIYRNRTLALFLEDTYLARDLDSKINSDTLQDLSVYHHPSREKLLRDLSNYNEPEFANKKEIRLNISIASQDLKRLNKGLYTNMEAKKLVTAIQDAFTKSQEARQPKKANLPKEAEAEKSVENQEVTDLVSIEGPSLAKSALPQISPSVCESDGINNMASLNTNKTNLGAEHPGGGEIFTNIPTIQDNSQVKSKKRSHKGAIKEIHVVDDNVTEDAQGFQVPTVQEAQTTVKKATGVESGNYDQTIVAAEISKGPTTTKPRNKKSKKKSKKTTRSTPFGSEGVQSVDSSEVEPSNKIDASNIEPAQVGSTELNPAVNTGISVASINTTCIPHAAQEGGKRTSLDPLIDEWEPHDQLLKSSDEDDWIKLERKGVKKSRGRGRESPRDFVEASSATQQRRIEVNDKNFRRHSRQPFASDHAHPERSDATKNKPTRMAGYTNQANTSSASMEKILQVQKPPTKSLSVPTSKLNPTPKVLQASTQASDLKRFPSLTTLKNPELATSGNVTSNINQNDNHDGQCALSPRSNEVNFPSLTPLPVQEAIISRKKSTREKGLKHLISPTHKNETPTKYNSANIQEDRSCSQLSISIDPKCSERLSEVSHMVDSSLADQTILHAQELNSLKTAEITTARNASPKIADPTTVSDASRYRLDAADLAEMVIDTPTITAKSQFTNVLNGHPSDFQSKAEKKTLTQQNVELSGSESPVAREMANHEVNMSSLHDNQLQDGTLTASQKSDKYCEKYLAFVDNIESPVKHKHIRERSSSILIPIPDDLTKAEYYQEKVCAGQRERSCTTSTYPPNAVGFDRSDLEHLLPPRATSNIPARNTNNASGSSASGRPLLHQTINTGSITQQMNYGGSTFDNSSLSHQITKNGPITQQNHLHALQRNNTRQYTTEMPEVSNNHGSAFQASDNRPHGGMSYHGSDYSQTRPHCTNCRLPDRPAVIQQPTWFCHFCTAGGPSNWYCSNYCMDEAARLHHMMHEAAGAPVLWQWGQPRPRWHNRH